MSLDINSNITTALPKLPYIVFYKYVMKLEWANKLM